MLDCYFWGYIHTDASTAIAMRFNRDRGMAGPFRKGLARVARDGKWRHINGEGKFVVEPRFDMAYEFSARIVIVILTMRAGYGNRNGELTVTTH